MPSKILMIFLCVSLTWLAGLAPALADDAPVAKDEQPVIELPSEVSLRPVFKVGQWARYDFWTLRSQSVQVNVAGKSQSRSNRMEMNGQMTWRVSRISPDGSSTCEMTIDYMTMTMTSDDGQSQTIDTRKGRSGDSPVDGMLRAMAGKTVAVEVGSDGTIGRVKGVEAIARAMPEGLNAPDDLDFAETASDLATLVAAPPEAQVGSHWKCKQRWNHPMGKVDQNWSYTLDSVGLVEGVPLAVVSGNATLKLDVDTSKFAGKPVRPDIRMTDGSCSTQVMFDLDRHEAVGRNTTSSSRVSTKISFSGRSLSTLMDETVQSQVLRTAEGE
ncbi:MAG: hypothetical protein GC164_07040 [Phycisphaera sp.]|nr:hypothetical protein [Phycisphaera sp.]